MKSNKRKQPSSSKSMQQLVMRTEEMLRKAALADLRRANSLSQSCVVPYRRIIE